VTPELQRSAGGVACLATPVLVSRPRRYHPLTSAMFDWMGVLPAAVVAHHLATFSAPLIGVAHDRAASLYWVALSAASFFLIRAIRRGLSAADFSVEPVALDNRRVLFIRMVGDEASAAISAAHVLSLVVERITTTPFHALGTVMAACEAMREAALER
jgi:hypothetical protein